MLKIDVGGHKPASRTSVFERALDFSFKSDIGILSLAGWVEFI